MADEKTDEELDAVPWSDGPGLTPGDKLKLRLAHRRFWEIRGGPPREDDFLYGSEDVPPDLRRVFDSKK